MSKSLKNCNICHSAKHKTTKCIQYQFCNDMLATKLEYIANTFGIINADRNIDFVRATFQILNVPCCGKNTLKYMVNRLLNQTVFWSAESNKQYFIRHHKQPSKPIGKMTFVQLQYFYKNLMQANINFYKEFNTDSENNTDPNDDTCPICLESTKGQKTCTTECGHSFCSPCFFTAMQSQIDQRGTSVCPLCRATCIKTRSRY